MRVVYFGEETNPHCSGEVRIPIGLLTALLEASLAGYATLDTYSDIAICQHNDTIIDIIKSGIQLNPEEVVRDWATVEIKRFEMKEEP